MTQSVYKSIATILLVGVLCLFPGSAFAQTDPNQSVYNSAVTDNNSVNSNAANQNQTIYNGVQSNNNDAYWQGTWDATTVKLDASSTNSSLPSGSIYNSWINSQASGANTSAKNAGASLNDSINKDIFNPNQSYTDINTGIYNAGKDANQKAVATGGTCKVDIKKFADIFIAATCIINNFLISLAISLAVVYFVWGIVQYVLSADSVEERKKSKQVMIWGVFALFCIVSVWGIVAAVRTLFNI